MAQRKQQKPRPTAAAASDRSARSPAAAGSKREQEGLDALRQERDELKRQLEAAKARIAILEKQKDDVLNRIDWVVDSLNSLLDSDA